MMSPMLKYHVRPGWDLNLQVLCNKSFDMNNDFRLSILMLREFVDQYLSAKLHGVIM